MPGLLSVVATPIGNLEDITLRALRVLREADLIAAEDTRHTARLLHHHGIRARTLSFHAHNARARLHQLLDRLKAGEHIALVSDAGTPGISDPGVELVERCRFLAIRVEAIPGPSAAIAAAVTSGFPLLRFSVLGFPPTRSKDRKRWFEEAAIIQHTFSFYEAPHRIEATFRDCGLYFVNRNICVCRELTKVHEESPIFLAQDLSAAPIRPKGEFTLVVAAEAQPANPGQTKSDEQIFSKFLEISRGPHQSRRDVLQRVAQDLGLTRSEVYQAIERSKRNHDR